MTFHVGAEHFVASILEGAIRPLPIVPFDKWLPQNIVLIDGPKKGEYWSAEDAPYLIEPAQCLSLEHPCNFVDIRKSQQTGVSILALAWSLYLAEQAPDNFLYGVPGKDALKDMNNGKMQPLIDAWGKATDKQIILPNISRSGEGSTVFEKRFDGGSIHLANANTVMDLSAKTCRYGTKDEVSKWQELPNGSDPEELFFGRFTAYRREKSFKILGLSTPEIDTGDELGEQPGHCRIDRAFKRSDQRFWNIRCPECRHEQVMFFENLEVNREHPHKSAYLCENAKCGHIISEIERVHAVRQGRYIATQTGPDRHPGFHIDAFISLMMSFEAIAEDYLSSEGKGDSGAKDFSNLVRALPFKLSGNAPDHERLMERREDYPEGVIPAQGLIFTGGADVQHNGIFVEAVAFGSDRQSWQISKEFLKGSTDDPKAGAWALLDDFYRRTFKDEFSQDRELEGLAVDSGDGGRTSQVYAWCKVRPRTYAIKGKHGRGVPAIGTPSNVEVKKNGKKSRLGKVLSWPVGTWTLKDELYGNLHKSGKAAGEEFDPPGYCHFAMWADEEYFKQLTAEYFSQKFVNGKFHQEWLKLRSDNHFLDSRIYAMAIAELLGLSKLTDEDWAKLRAKLIPAQALDLFSTESQKLAAAASPASAAKAPVKTPAPSSAPSLADIAKKMNG